MEWLNINSTYGLNIHTFNIQEHHLPLTKGLMKGSIYLIVLTKLCVSQVSWHVCNVLQHPVQFSEFFTSWQVLLGFHSGYINMLYCCSTHLVTRLCPLSGDPCRVKFFWRWCIKQAGCTEGWAAAWHCSTHFNCVCVFTYFNLHRVVIMLIWYACDCGHLATLLHLRYDYVGSIWGCNLLDLYELRVHTMSISTSYSTEHAIVTCFMVLASIKFEKFRHTCRNRWTGRDKHLDFSHENFLPCW